MSNFVSRIFDMSFKEFITPSIIKVVFWIAVILIALGVLFNIVTEFMVGFGSGLIALIISLLVGALLVIMARIYLELIMVLFRIVGLLDGMAKAKGVEAVPPVPEPPPAP
ncbi:MAG: DUF4282 domain-containing protein [Desulfarculaceae bacterium]|jgi:hypothetical protein